MSDHPDTPLWEELRRRAAQDGVLAIDVRGAGAQPARVVEIRWPGGEVETLRFRTGDDLEALAHALADELGIALAPPAG